MPHPAPQPLLRLRQAVLGYQVRSPLASPLDFDLPAGAFLVVAGPNGAGKSTFVRSLLDVQPLLGGSREARQGLRFGYVPQSGRLDPIWPFSVRELVEMGAIPTQGLLRRNRRALRERSLALLEDMGLADRAETPFRNLSGGQQQRVLIARALVGKPEVLVLDEPTNHLDRPGENAVLRWLGEIHGGGDTTLVVISHRLEPLFPHATHLAVLREGRFVSGTSDEVRESGALADLVEEGGLR